MESMDLQTTLAIAVIVTSAVVVVVFDYLKRHQPNRIKPDKAARAERSAGLESASPNYSATKRVGGVSGSGSLVTAAPSRSPVLQRIEREKVTVEMAPPSPSAPSSPVASLPPITVDTALWERLLGSEPKLKLISSPYCSANVAGQSTQLSILPGLGSEDTIEASYRMIRDDANPLVPRKLPAGMVQQPEFEELLERQEPFTGLVVSIGTNDSDSSMWHSQGFMQSVGSFISTLLGESDLCCRTAYDEFVMVCPGDRSAEWQRRLNHISERLWDYQLSGMGAGSILFSWGGVQVQDQPLADAVASATERMRETKRSGRMAEHAVAQRQFL